MTFAAVHAGDVEATAAAFAGLGEERRRALAAEVVAGFRRHRTERWNTGRATALAVAAVGGLPGAAAAADLLTHPTVFPGESAVEPVVAAAGERGVPWLGDLAARLALRLPDVTSRWRFTAGLLLSTEVAPPPGADRFAEQWLALLDWPMEEVRHIPIADRLRTDPFLAVLLPRLFEIDGIGVRLGSVNDDRSERQAMLHALAQLAAEGLLDRAALLDGCLGRLLRGDRPAAVRTFLTLLDLLQPTEEEVGRRSGDYLRLLADGPGPAAAMAQRTLRDRADPDAVLEVSAAVLARPEKGVVTAQLAMLDALVRRHPERAPEAVAVVAAALDALPTDLRDRAQALLTKRDVAAIRPAAAEPRGDDLPPRLAPPAPAAPITSADELAEEVAALPASLTALTAAPLERVLDGLVRLAGTDRPALARALDPVLRRRRVPAGGFAWQPMALDGLLGGALYAAASLSTAPGAVAAVAGAGRWVPAPHRLLQARLAEIADAAGDGYPGLLAAPTSSTGALDPGVLLDRLGALGEREPWPGDLHQALLRLPAVPDPAAAKRAAKLRTPAGARVAAWLRAGGLADVTTEVVTVPGEELVTASRWDWVPERRTVVRVTGGGMFGPFRASAVDHREWSGLWPAVLPGYRQLAAAYALPDIAAAADLDRRGGAAVLPSLADCTGPGGDAFDLVLAYGLAARHDIDRSAALDALLAVAADGQLDPQGVGRWLGELAASGPHTPPVRTVGRSTDRTHATNPTLGRSTDRTHTTNPTLGRSTDRTHTTNPTLGRSTDRRWSSPASLRRCATRPRPARCSRSGACSPPPCRPCWPPPRQPAARPTC
ncbi:DUF6493 family protein [Dactylosporangium sp. AC04546]|uniref:DUF6493 family protein n=1 Tax=Dactylosporangium sp. AC04546 TaxID=2862460 RepID=UPI002E7AC9EF|nr:DUF6493 family protein [Dactylosporangium sp. AC04546]WVK87695.1 DUF6493 family protein [Dactylosporangium sp. AC04546]